MTSYVAPTKKFNLSDYKLKLCELSTSKVSFSLTKKGNSFHLFHLYQFPNNLIALNSFSKQFHSRPDTVHTSNRNLSTQTPQFLKTLEINQNKVIRSAGKVGGTVIENSDYYIEEAMHSTQSHTCVDIDLFPLVQKNVITFINNASSHLLLMKNENKIHHHSQPRPISYHPPKIHKNLQNPLGHPIMSEINSIVSNRSQYLDITLQQYVTFLDSYLSDSGQRFKIYNQTHGRSLINLIQ